MLAGGSGPILREVGALPCTLFPSRRRHTRYSGDWSSDVCSSDLLRRHETHFFHGWIEMEESENGRQQIGGEASVIHALEVGIAHRKGGVEGGCDGRFRGMPGFPDAEFRSHPAWIPSTIGIDCVGWIAEQEQRRYTREGGP